MGAHSPKREIQTEILSIKAQQPIVQSIENKDSKHKNSKRDLMQKLSLEVRECTTLDSQINIELEAPILVISSKASSLIGDSFIKSN